MKKNTNIFTPTVTLGIKTLSPVSYDETRNDGLKQATYTMGRFWNVSVTGNISFTNPVSVRFFYLPADTMNMRNAAAAKAITYGLTSAQIYGIEWFKTTAGIQYKPSNNTYNDVPNKMVLAPVYGTLNGISYAEFGGLYSFSGGTAGMRLSPGGYALPVKMLYFTATPEDNSYIKLDWATASEIDNSGFELQRSTDGASFKDMAWIPGMGNSTTTNVYRYDDRTCDPNVVYYYRLKQIDIDGVFEYSNIVSAILIGEHGFAMEELKPNPATNKVNVNVISSVNNPSRIAVIDMLGRIVINQQWALYSGLNGIDLDLSDVSSGTYTVTVYSGNIVSSKKLVVFK